MLFLSGCGGVPSFSVPSVPDLSKTGSATFEINGTTFVVSQSGTIKADFPESKVISYSGPLGCRGHYFNGSYTEDIEVFFRYFKNAAYLLIDNGAEPVYRFGPPARSGRRLTFSDPNPRDRRITVVVDCPAGA
jgi:hypothetical protein